MCTFSDTDFQKLVLNETDAEKEAVRNAFEVQDMRSSGSIIAESRSLLGLGDDVSSDSDGARA